MFPLLLFFIIKVYTSSVHEDEVGALYNKIKEDQSKSRDGAEVSQTSAQCCDGEVSSYSREECRM